MNVRLSESEVERIILEYFHSRHLKVRSYSLDFSGFQDAIAKNFEVESDHCMLSVDLDIETPKPKKRWWWRRK